MTAQTQHEHSVAQSSDCARKNCTLEGATPLQAHPDEQNEFRPSTISVLLQPEEKMLELPRATCKNVGQLLKTLGLRQSTAIVAREGTLLTPDVPLYPGQSMLVRKVMSSG